MSKTPSAKKALLKKELQESMMSMTASRAQKKWSQKSVTGRGKRAAMWVAAIFIICGFVFVQMFRPLVSTLQASNILWVYFGLIGIMSIGMSVLGSAFTVYNKLYMSRDNDLLLSMPVKPGDILLARMTGCYLLALIFGVIVWVPGIIAAFLEGVKAPLMVLLSVLDTFIIPLFSTVLGCIFGWLIALLTARMTEKVKNKFTTILSVIFLGVYMVCIFRVQNGLQLLISKADRIAGSMNKSLILLGFLGKGAAGSILNFLLFMAASLVLFGVVYWLLSVTFIKMAVAKRSGKKTKYVRKAQKRASVSKALYRRELQHYTTSSVYLLNCGMGSVFLILAIIVFCIKHDAAMDMLNSLAGVGANMGPMLIVIAICVMAGNNTITAPSISLEGKNLWLAKSLPVSAWQIFKAKLELHMVMTIIPVWAADIAAAIFCKMDVLSIIGMFLLTTAAAGMEALLGLCVNVKRPKLEWTNEAAAIKTDLSLIGVLFGGVILQLAVCVGAIALSVVIGNGLSLLAASVIFIAADLIMIRWLKKTGTLIFKYL